MIGKIAVGGVEEGGCLFGGWWVLENEKEYTGCSTGSYKDKTHRRKVPCKHVRLIDR